MQYSTSTERRDMIAIIISCDLYHGVAKNNYRSFARHILESFQITTPGNAKDICIVFSNIDQYIVVTASDAGSFNAA
jgi:hypothetical protein